MKKRTSEIGEVIGRQPRDVQHLTARAALSAVGSVPLIGPAIFEVLDYLILNPAQDRRDKFLAEVLERLQALESAGGVSLSELQESVEFQTTFIRAMRIAAREPQPEKLEFLRNAILNTAGRPSSIANDVQSALLGALERMTPTHIRMLVAMEPSNSSGNYYRIRDIAQSAWPEDVQYEYPPSDKYLETGDLLRSMVGEIVALGLASSSVREPEGIATPGQAPDSVKLSTLGRRLLELIRSPESQICGV